MQILFDNWTGRYDDECLMPGDIVEAAMVYNFRENAGNQTDTMIRMGEVADIVCNKPIYDTIYKENRYSPWKYAGQCYPGELKNVIKTSLAFSDVNSEFDYLRRLYNNLIGNIDGTDIETLYAQGFTVREIEKLKGESKSSVSRKLNKEGVQDE